MCQSENCLCRLFEETFKMNASSVTLHPHPSNFMTKLIIHLIGQAIGGFIRNAQWREVTD